MATYIIFDTNILFVRNHVNFSEYTFNKIYKEIEGKIERHSVEGNFILLIPEITINELFQQQLDEFEENINTLLTIYKKCERMYEIDLKVDEEFEYSTYLDELKANYIKHNNFEIIPTCSGDRFSNIVERALSKRAPFEGGNKGNSDKGFKDALIWESILEYASNNEQDAEYIFLTNDKGFREKLINEFKEETNKKISFYNKDEKQKLDTHIEKYSEEKVIKSKRQIINNNIYDILNDLILDIETRVFNNIIINGITCQISRFEIFDEIVDLNEYGEEFFQFKLKGKALAEKPGLSYDFKLNIKVLVKFSNNDDLDIVQFLIDDIEATLIAGDILNLTFEPYEFLPISEETFALEDQEALVEMVDEEVQEEQKEQNEQEKRNTERDPTKLKKLKKLVKAEKYKKILRDAEIEKLDESLKEFSLVLVSNFQSDWMNSLTRKAQLKVALKRFFRKNIDNDTRIPEIVDEIISELERDTLRFLQ